MCMRTSRGHVLNRDHVEVTVASWPGRWESNTQGLEPLVGGEEIDSLSQRDERIRRANRDYGYTLSEIGRKLKDWLQISLFHGDPAPARCCTGARRTREKEQCGSIPLGTGI